MVLENEADYKSRSQVISSLSKKFGCSGDTLRGWVKKQDVESGTRDGVTQSERDELRALHREIRELTQANEILRKASPFFAAADLDRLLKRRPLLIEDHRGEYGVEAICTILPIAPFTYYHHQSLQRDPSRAARWAQSDAELCPKIKGSYQTSHKRYGAVKVWYDLIAVGETVARCTVVRLMKDTEIQGVTRGKGKKTTQGNSALPCPEDKVNRVFNAPAPNVLWVADFTYVRTAVGFVYVAFIIDVFAGYIVGWQV